MPEKHPAVVLEQALAHFRGELTVADAAARSGLPLRDAEEGLRVLAADYAGHLSATSKGELIYAFPRGLVKPPETRLLRRIGRGLVKFVLGGVRLIVRAWVSVVLVGYALVFLAILLALTLRGGDDRDGGVADGMGTVLRVIAEALFWTFHPFSPVFIGAEPRWIQSAGGRRPRLPFYERVNRFVFGPGQPRPDPREQERQVLAEIRRQKGRIAPGDVMRVTGGSREEAELLLLRLVVDYQGDITVSETGAILYSFAELRITTDRADRTATPSPIWNRRAELPPLTGNSIGSNLMFAFINGFNLIASGFVLANGLTLERLTAIFARLATHDPSLVTMPLPPPDGIPLVLGAIPFAFSLALFALPLVRALRRPAEVRRIARENGWRAVLRHVLATLPSVPEAEYTRDQLARAWEAAAGRPATEADLEHALQNLGGEVHLRADGTLVYRFDVVAREIEALAAVRAGVTDDEVSPGEVVFSSADEGAGIRDAPRPRAAPASDTAAGAPTQARTQDGGGSPGKDDDQDRRPSVPLLEESRQPMEFIERLLVDSTRRRK